MFEALKGWIVTIITAVFFITAVEMILPDNNLKKYAKFVLGLILVTVFINPIIKVFDKSFDMSTYTSNAMECFDKKKCDDDFQVYKEKSLNNTLETFKLNLQSSCEKKLKEKFPNNECKVQVEVAYDEKSKKIDIKSIKVGVKEGKIDRVKKVKIGGDAKSVNGTESIDDEKSLAIKKCIGDELNLSKELIKTYKL